MSQNWSDMTNDQLQGADCAFQTLRGSLRGLLDAHPDDLTVAAILKFTEENQLEVFREMSTRPALLIDKSRILT